MKTLESIAGRHALVSCGECQCEGPPCAALIDLLREAQRALLEEIGEAIVDKAKVSVDETGSE